MSDIINSFVPFFFIIVLLILVHEIGHFTAAKLFGVRVLEFGVGFPPRLAAVKRGDTEYSVNALPLGGFVRLLGEEDPSDPASLAAKSRPVRIIVLSAGALMNFVLAIVLFSVAYMIPREVSVGRPIINEVVAGSPAEEAGLQTGDIIYEINGREIKNTQEASYNIRLNLGETMTMTVKRGREFVDLRVRARWAPPEGQGPTGIQIAPQYPFTEMQSYPPWKAVPLGWRASFDALKLARNEVIAWIKGASSPQVAGPVGIAQATGEVVKEAGWKSLTDLAALLSINLAVINILPLPMLDGGRIVFVLLEILRRGRRIAPQREALVHLIGLVFFMTLFVVISYFDIVRIIRGESFFR
ncbi:MAG: M50 family metallopeptidase [Dehalococcoidia bacterium]|nr:M50 family metallopeptidase [Dehalococcoidia bacterium]